MNPGMIVGIILVISVIVGIIYAVNYNNLQALRLKINESENVIDELLRSKYDLINNIIEVILKETKVNKKTFDEIKNSNFQNISSFDFERKLTSFNQLIIKVKDDYEELESNIDFSNYLNELMLINQKLEASKSFYNKYTNILNKTIKRFPSSFIAFIHHIKVRTFFDGKDMFDDDLKDFKL